jgi:hypothetical protein
MLHARYSNYQRTINEKEVLFDLINARGYLTFISEDVVIFLSGENNSPRSYAEDHITSLVISLFTIMDKLNITLEQCLIAQVEKQERLYGSLFKTAEEE